MTPRKWTAADVTEEDHDAITEDAGAHGITPREIATCWNRLEEKRVSDCGPVGHLRQDVLLAQALEALREVLSGWENNGDVYQGKLEEAIAALEKEVGA